MKKIILLCFLILLSACGKDEDETKNIDRKAMIENYAEIILQSYSKTSLSADLLQECVNNFVAHPDTTHLQLAQEALLQLYEDFQGITFLDFGPSEQLLLRESLNTYPADTTNIKLIIQTGSYNIGTVANRSKGLPAIEYLLFGIGSSREEIAAYYTANSYKDYLQATTNEVKRIFSEVYSMWQNDSGTGYYKTFVAAQGLDINSALGLMVNSLCLDFEKYFRDGKLGIPLGIRTLGIPQLDKVESLYAGKSLNLIIQNMESIKSFYSGGNGQGLYDYLNAIGAKYNEQPLSTEIISKMDTIITRANALEGESIEYNILHNKEAVENLYASCQELILLLKIDMTSAMSILITYQDTDGD